jgi:hypothetical protein
MPRFRIISEPIENNAKKDIELDYHEECNLRLSHGLYQFLKLDIMPTETHLLTGRMGKAFMKFWRIRKRIKDIFSIGIFDN